jgi:hypothetical protein
LITTPLNNEMAIIGFILNGNVATFKMAANKTKAVPMMMYFLFEFIINVFAAKIGK